MSTATGWPQVSHVRLAARHVQATRDLLRELLVGDLTFTPDPSGIVRFTGQGTLAPLMGRLQIPAVQALVTPAGFDRFGITVSLATIYRKAA